MKSRYIEDNELQNVLQSVARDKKSMVFYLPLVVALETGLRVGDVIKIKRSEVVGNDINYIAQKTGKKGIAHLTNTTRKLLVENYVENSGEWLFPSPVNKGEHITRQAVWKRAKKLARSSGVDPSGFSPHSMRKNFAVKTFREHGIKATQNALQHSRIDTTEIYALSDYSTGENGNKPILRKELDLIFKLLQQFLISEMRNTN